MLAIPPKRFDHALITYLTEPEDDALLAAPDQSTWTGRRDHALLLVAVQTGLRVSALIGLTWPDVHLGANGNLHHAATATRQCPSMASREVTAHVLRHTTAMRLLHANIDTSVIALWLGHVSVETTQIYYADFGIMPIRSSDHLCGRGSGLLRSA